MLHSQDSLIVVVFVLHVETFSGLKREINSLHEHCVCFGSGCLRQSLPGLKGLKVNGVETFSGLTWDFNSLQKHSVFGSGCLRQSLPGLKGLKVNGVETFSGLTWDFNSLQKHGVFGSGRLRQSLPGLEGLKCKSPVQSIDYFYFLLMCVKCQTK